MSVAAVDEALEEYRGVVLDHPRLRETVHALRSSLVPGQGPRILAVVGPTGVGKTTVLRAVERAFAEESRPVVQVVCLPPGNKGFEFGQLHWRLLSQAAGGKFPDEHVCPDNEADRLKAGGGVRQGNGTVDDQRLGVLTFLRQHGVCAVIFDEAQYVTRIRGSRSQADQLDIVKDCVDRSGIPHVLAGTYELNALFAANEQAVRRLRVHHFRPYYLDAEADREAFAGIVGQLLLELPLPEPRRSLEALEPHLRAICVRSLGCVGVLKDWFADGLRTALQKGRDVVDWSALTAPGCGISNADRIELAKKIHENRRLGEENDLKDVERELGLTADWDLSRAAVRTGGNARKPGRRKAVRDAVGLTSEGVHSGPARTGTA